MKRLIVAMMCALILFCVSAAICADDPACTEHWRLNCSVDGRIVSWAIGFVHYDLKSPFTGFPWKGGVKVGARTEENIYNGTLVAHQYFAERSEANSWVKGLENNFKTPEKKK